MDNVALLPDAQRGEIFRETAARKGMTPAIVEKDFWVCWILGKLFTNEITSNKILFKGGTSLSKVFGLIHRFSEDIDLILDWNEIVTENPEIERTKTKQKKYNDQIREKANCYLKETFLPKVEKIVDGVCSAQMHEDKSNVITVKYPKLFKDNYTRPEIWLEIGVFAGWLPNGPYTVTPYAAEEFPNIFTQTTARVNAIRAERTFWEKATILHQEAHRAQDNPQPARYSRHYYDLSLMADAEVKQIAFSNLRLLRDVVDFKMKFYPCGWANYALASPGTFRLIPPDHVARDLERDYKEMEFMIFGHVPTVKEIMRSIEKLESEINEL